jgi:hypothetical protein
MGGGGHFSLRALVGLLIKNLEIQKSHEKEEMLCRQITEYIIASCICMAIFKLQSKLPIMILKCILKNLDIYAHKCNLIFHALL